VSYVSKSQAEQLRIFLPIYRFTSGDEPELEKNTKPLKVTVMLDDDSGLDYTFSKLKEGSGYLLQRSDQSARYKIADWGVSPLKDTEREKLVETKSLEEEDSQ